jgi:hypothetical protein
MPSDSIVKKDKHFFHDRIETFKANLKVTEDERLKRVQRSNQLRDQLWGVGLSSHDMRDPTTFHLGNILFHDEKIDAGVVGRTENKSKMLLIATNLRIVCLTQIPFFTDSDEFSYETVQGVSLETSRFGSTVILHAAIGTFTVNTRNKTAAKKFVDCVERTSIKDEAIVDNLVPKL